MFYFCCLVKIAHRNSAVHFPLGDIDEQMTRMVTCPRSYRKIPIHLMSGSGKYAYFWYCLY